jgi:hypothetical protein
MAVVINELEVAPLSAAPAAQAQQGQKQAGAGAPSPEAVKAMEKTLHKKHQRSYRLEAY